MTDEYRFNNRSRQCLLGDLRQFGHAPHAPGHEPALGGPRQEGMAGQLRPRRRLPGCLDEQNLMG